MNEIKPFQPLQVPAAITVSAFAVIALTEMRELDPDSASFDLSTVIVSIIFWTISVGAASWNSPQAQGAASGVFTITALIGERIPGSSEYGHDELAGISPTLWVMSGVMCGSAVATCATVNQMSKLRSSLGIKDLHFPASWHLLPLPAHRIHVYGFPLDSSEQPSLLSFAVSQ